MKNKFDDQNQNKQMKKSNQIENKNTRVKTNR